MSVDFLLSQSFVLELVLEGCALDLDGPLLLVEDEVRVWLADPWLVVIGICGLEVALPVLESAEVADDISVSA